MYGSRGWVDGDIHQWERPEWAPLLDAVGESLTGWFMWMGEMALEDGRRVHAYKHSVTRRYLHLDAHGAAYLYELGGFLEVPLHYAIPTAFVGLASSGVEDADLREVDAAVRRAEGCRVIDADGNEVG